MHERHESCCSTLDPILCGNHLSPLLCTEAFPLELAKILLHRIRKMNALNGADLRKALASKDKSLF